MLVRFAKLKIMQLFGYLDCVGYTVSLRFEAFVAFGRWERPAYFEQYKSHVSKFPLWQIIVDFWKQII